MLAVVVALIAGCGTTVSRTAVPTRPPARAAASAPAGTPIVTIPQLGALAYRCDSTGRRVAVTLSGAPFPMIGGSTTVEGDNGVHLRVPGTRTRTTPFGAYRSLTWRMILTNEGRSVVATVRLHFGRSCTLAHWTVDGQVIGHEHKWSNPPAWP